MDAAVHKRVNVTIRFIIAAIVAAIWAFAPLIPTTPASAVSYSGFGDTGWTNANKRDCCRSALALAEQDSIYHCAFAGGEAKLYPPANRKGTRGDCEWDGRGDGMNRVYRCTAKTDIYCQSS